MPQPDAPAGGDAVAEIAAARDRVIKNLHEGAIVVSARDVRKLLTGFDMMVNRIASGEAAATQRGAMRIAAIMHRLDTPEVTIDETDLESLRARGGKLAQGGDGEHTLTYRLVYPDDAAAPQSDDRLDSNPDAQAA